MSVEKTTSSNGDVPAEEIGEKELGDVSGGFNPQPDPPGRVAKPVISQPVFAPIVTITPSGH